MTVCVGDEIRLVDPFVDHHGNLIFDNDHESYIVLNPDWLLGATTISGGVTCRRR